MVAVWLPILVLKGVAGRRGHSCTNPCTQPRLPCCCIYRRGPQTRPVMRNQLEKAYVCWALQFILFGANGSSDLV